jgi:hypothetical protein
MTAETSSLLPTLAFLGCPGADAEAVLPRTATETPSDPRPTPNSLACQEWQARATRQKAAVPQRFRGNSS